MDNLKAAVRSLLSTPGPTTVVIATLAIAIGANTAIFSVVSGVLLRPLGYGDDSGIVVLWATHASDELDLFRLSPADYRDVRDGADAFDGRVALYRFIGSTLTARERPIRVGSLAVTPRLFRILATKAAVGQFFTDEDERPGSGKKVVLTHASWTRRFGADPSIVGSTVELDSEPYTVLGVTERGFQFPPGNGEVEMYFPMSLSDAILLDRNHRMFDAVARLADGVTLEAARAELETLSNRLAREFPDTNRGWGLTARPLHEEMFGDLTATLWVLSGAVFLVLLIACVNTANILAARSIAVDREYAVRAALGARATDLFKRSLAESLILGVLGTAGGLLLTFWGVALLRDVMPAEIPRGEAIGVDGSVLLFALGLSIGSTLLFGSLPALRGVAPDVLELLKPAGAFGIPIGGRRRLRELMVVVEVALAIVLVVGAGLMVRSFVRLSEVEPGFRRQGVVSVAVQLPRSRYDRSEGRPFFESLVERVRRLPGVQSAGAASDLPMSDVGLAFELEFSVLGLDAVSPEARPNADIRLVVPSYFDAMDISIVQGRAFDSLDATSDRAVAIVNETLVSRYFRDSDPIGRSVRLNLFGELEIVGVVSDVRHRGLQSKYESEIYLPYGRIATMEMHVVVQSNLDTASVAGAVTDVLREMDPQLAPSRIVAISDLLWESVAQPRFNTALLSGMASCAAVLALIGIYGIVAYSVSTRTGEIGLRIALGADSTKAVSTIVRRALGVVGVGLILGTLGALGAMQFLSRFLYDVQAADPLTYSIVLVLAVLVSVLAAWMPARRATRIDPVVALRGE
ncbi:MAG TPA: ABC transporter permease [Vicinamibacteria bacterium]|nr:ABC transporter permease [Vicinamibacteria bacterium]